MVSMLSDKGNVRELNEDCLDFYEDENIRVYIIADGMGGYNAGEVASKLAVSTTLDYIRNCTVANIPLDELLKMAIKNSNSIIFNMSQNNTDYSGMGTTITACLISDLQMVVANVGDSSCYIIKDNSIYKVTKDHSLVQQLIDNGTITPEEALHHPNKNIITRALGTSTSIDIDIFKIDLKNVFKVVLCTDGLTNQVNSDEILEIVNNNDNTIACEKLIHLSKEKGGNDNISVIVFEGECKNDRNCTRK